MPFVVIESLEKQKGINDFKYFHFPTPYDKAFESWCRYYDVKIDFSYFLLGSKGEEVRYDYYLPAIELIVEVFGPEKKVNNRDRLKRNTALALNKRILYLPHWGIPPWAYEHSQGKTKKEAKEPHVLDVLSHIYSLQERDYDLI